MGNAVGWFEIGAADDEPLKSFYSELFGWQLESVAGGYTMIDTRAGGAGIKGGIGRSQTGEPWVTFYVDADDPQGVLDRAGAMGGKTVVPVTEIPDVVTFAMFRDPDGLLIGVTKTSTGVEEPQPAPSPGGGAPVDWFEVLGSDAERTQTFYRDLFGWKIDTAAMPGYGLVDTGAGRGISGGIGAAEDGRWVTVYASVDDVEKRLARAEELGGTRVYGPMAVDDHMQTGAFRDPAGNVFGVYHHGAH